MDIIPLLAHRLLSPLVTHLHPQHQFLLYQKITIAIRTTHGSYTISYLWSPLSTFSWNNPSSWGESCGSTTKLLAIYIANNSTRPPIATFTANSPTNSSNYTFSLSGNYSWWIKANNGKQGNK